MAYRRKYRTSRRKRYNKKYRKKRYLKKKYSSLLKVNRPFRSVCYTKLRFAFTHEFALINLTGVNADNISSLAMNSLYDPLQAAGDGQPRWYQKLDDIYLYYRVRAMKVSCTWINRSTTYDAYVGMYPRGTSSKHTTIEDLMMNPVVTWRFLNADGSNKSTGKTKFYVNFKKYGTKAKTGDNFLSSTSGNPATILYWTPFAFDAVETNACDVVGNFTITFYTKFSELKMYTDA